MATRKAKRFEVVHRESYAFASEAMVLRDKVTGICYLYIHAGYSGGLTPLLDSMGKPVVDSGFGFEK